MWFFTQPSLSSCFSDNDILMLIIPYFSDSSSAIFIEFSYFSRGQLDKYFFLKLISTDDTCITTSRFDQFPSTKWSDFQIKYIYSLWDMFELFSIACDDRRFFSIDNSRTDRGTFSSQDISFFSISIMQKDNSRSPIRIIFDACDLCWDVTFIISSKVDDPV